MAKIREFMESAEANCSTAQELVELTLAEFGYGLLNEEAITKLAFEIIASTVPA